MNNNTFKRGFFSSLVSDSQIDFSESSIKQSHRRLVESSYQNNRTTVFLSHKHDDLYDNKEVIGICGMLERDYKVIVYVDGNDPKMPKNTSGDTASRLKDQIIKNDKFMLLLSEGALKSNWCNWELGFGDANKYPNNIAIFPISTNGRDEEYSGQEYLEIYPHVVYRDGTTTYRNSDAKIDKGYYVRWWDKNEKIYRITKLSKWFSER